MTPIKKPNGDIIMHPIEEDRNTRAYLLRTWQIRPTDSALYDPWYIRRLPALALDEAGHLAASRHIALGPEDDRTAN